MFGWNLELASRFVTLSIHTVSNTNFYPEETNVNRFYTNCLNNNEIDDEGYKILKKYFPGVGTEWYNRLRGGMFGYGINEQIENAYKYISTNYRDSEDQIWLIGFSRGGNNIYIKFF